MGLQLVGAKKPRKPARPPMENPVPTYDVATWIGRLSVHQDFFWFFSLLIWSLALIVWWCHPARRSLWAWFPGAGLATVAMTLLQFGMFNPTFDIFQERLIPGTVSTYRPALIDAYWLGDVLTGAALAAVAAGWGWMAADRTGRPHLRWLPVAVMPLVTAIHAVDPVGGGLLLTVLTALGTAALWRSTAGSAFSRTGLVLAALLPVLSTVGPVAALLGMVQRHGPPSPAGLGAALFQMLLGAILLAGLMRGLWSRLAADTHDAFRRDAGRFAFGAALLPPGDAAQGLAALADDPAAGRWRLSEVPLPEIVGKAGRLSLVHTVAGGHRAFDILHVAHARLVAPKRFVSFDANQPRLAKAVGLKC